MFWGHCHEIQSEALLKCHLQVKMSVLYSMGLTLPFTEHTHAPKIINLLI